MSLRRVYVNANHMAIYSAGPVDQSIVMLQLIGFTIYPIFILPFSSKHVPLLEGLSGTDATTDATSCVLAKNERKTMFLLLGMHHASESRLSERPSRVRSDSTLKKYVWTIAQRPWKTKSYC